MTSFSVSAHVNHRFTGWMDCGRKLKVGGRARAWCNTPVRKPRAMLQALRVCSSGLKSLTSGQAKIWETETVSQILQRSLKIQHKLALLPHQNTLKPCFTTNLVFI